ncbi:hypothetical protein AAFF_G00126370 [Aldrovandia affinis]|uniref:Uncharacterized protein n=1 Tax=Aldrovandia affinis TaxID=143900 RepID=A0AAD7RTU8_9TELE|nr:hypothetical protein AAFF_G00126370 [Aldrovandia affinis]
MPVFQPRMRKELTGIPGFHIYTSIDESPARYYFPSTSSALPEQSVRLELKDSGLQWCQLCGWRGRHQAPCCGQCPVGQGLRPVSAIVSLHPRAILPYPTEMTAGIPNQEMPVFPPRITGKLTGIPGFCGYESTEQSVRLELKDSGLQWCQLCGWRGRHQAPCCRQCPVPQDESPAHYHPASTSALQEQSVRLELKEPGLQWCQLCGWRGTLQTPCCGQCPVGHDPGLRPPPEAASPVQWTLQHFPTDMHTSVINLDIPWLASRTGVEQTGLPGFHGDEPTAESPADYHPAPISSVLPEQSVILELKDSGLQWCQLCGWRGRHQAPCCRQCPVPQGTTSPEKHSICSSPSLKTG